MKRNNIEEMHKQMFILVNLLKKDGHDPLAIAGCMLAGAVQIYQAELGEDTAFQLLDQIANGGDDDLILMKVLTKKQYTDILCV